MTFCPLQEWRSKLKWAGFSLFPFINLLLLAVITCRESLCFGSAINLPGLSDRTSSVTATVPSPKLQINTLYKTWKATTYKSKPSTFETELKSQSQSAAPKLNCDLSYQRTVRYQQVPPPITPLLKSSSERWESKTWALDVISLTRVLIYSIWRVQMILFMWDHVVSTPTKETWEI